MRGIRFTIVALVSFLAATGSASAVCDVTITGAPTTSMSAGPAFAPTAPGANLDVDDLNSALTTTSASVTTAGPCVEDGNLTVNTANTTTSLGSNSLLLTANADITLTTSPISSSGNLTVLAGGVNGISQDADSPIVVGGATTFNETTDGAAIDLSNSDNDFVGLAVDANGPVDVRDVSALNLLPVNNVPSSMPVIPPVLAFTVSGALTQSGSVTAAGETQINSFSNINLGNASNSFGGAVSVPNFATSVTLNGSGAVPLGNINVDDGSFGGNLNVTSGGAITSLGNQSVEGTTTLTAPGGAITAGSVTSNFKGAVTSTAGGLLTLRDGGALVLGTTSSNGGDIFAGGDLTQSGAINGGASQFDAEGASVTLTNAANNFSSSQFEATGGDLSVVDANSITLVGANATGSSQVVAGLDLAVTANPAFTADSLTLVADEAAGNSVGTGGVTVPSGAVLNSTGAPLRLYGGDRDENSIAANATFNGATFTPGPEFVDSAREVWGTRFPNGTGTNPFTIFYKQPGTPPDTTPPETTIDSGPAQGTTIDDATPTFAFSSSEAGSTFACAIDAGAFAACTSPHTTAALADGSHTFAVRATDAAGNTDASPATRDFTVDTTPDVNPPPAGDTTAPDTTLTKTPKKTTKTTKKKVSVTFEFASTEAGSTFECSLDGVAFTSCTSPHKFKAKKGQHTFLVRATDAAGNVDGTPASFGFKVKRKQKNN